MRAALLVVTGAVLFRCAPADALLVRPNDRVAICGDRVTAGTSYAVDLEGYLVMCEGVPGVDVAQFGGGGQTVEEFLARIETDLLPYRPDVVTTCLGVAENVEGALDEAAAGRVRKAYVDLVHALRKAGARAIVLGSPKCVDSFHYRRDPARAAERNRALAAVADVIRRAAAAERVAYADVFGRTSKAMAALKRRNGDDYMFDREDGCGPSVGCRLATAYAFLEALGASGELGTITIDYRAGTAACDGRQKIVSAEGKAWGIAERIVTVESTRYPFIFYDRRLHDEGVLECVPFHRRFNRYILVVKNVPSPRMKVSWNFTPYSELRMHESSNFAADELARGVVMPERFGHVPFGPFGKVQDAVNDKQNRERAGGAAFLGSPERAALVGTIRERFVPTAHKLRLMTLAEERLSRRPGPVNVIVDTDMSGDCDDAGALALVHSFMNRGEAKLIACVCNGRDADVCSGATVHAIDAYYGRPNTPIGANHAEAWIGPTRSHYTRKTRERFAPDFPTDDRLPAGVDVYRRALASAPDGSVAIVSLGLLENLRDLVRSGPDEASRLSGLDLVKRKVRELVVMSNTNRNDDTVIGVWPTDVMFTFGVGSFISTGKSLIGTPEENPVRFVYSLFGEDEERNALMNGRQSWDLTASWLAVRGPGDLWDVSWGGRFTVDPESGRGSWREGPQGNHRYVLERMHVPDVQALLDAELARPPR